MIFLFSKEVATIRVPAYLFAKELKENYPNVALFTMHSSAEIITSEGIIVDTEKSLDIVTKLRPREPPSISQAPGQVANGCGERGTCHKYADCHYAFYTQAFICRCVPGFQGDGYQNCERATSM